MCSIPEDVAVRRLTTIGLVTVCLAGCQSTPALVWERPGATVDDVQRDESVCHDFVQKTWGTIQAGPLSREYFADCMRAHGYTGRVPPPGETPSLPVLDNPRGHRPQ
jgi:hypothetical protein